MGDKGGKKDKAKQEQQLARKQQEKQGKKQDKAPPKPRGAGKQRTRYEREAQPPDGASFLSDPHRAPAPPTRQEAPGAGGLPAPGHRPRRGRIGSEAPSAEQPGSVPAGTRHMTNGATMSYDAASTDTDTADPIARQQPSRMPYGRYQPYHRQFSIELPDRQWPNRLIERLERPIIATSANRSGYSTCRSGIEVFGTMDGRVDLILDAGEADRLPATTVDITLPQWNVIKVGAITEAQLDDCLSGA